MAGPGSPYHGPTVSQTAQGALGGAEPVGAVCQECDELNWTETGLIDASTGQPVPSIPYKIFDVGTKEVLASGVLDDQGLSPRHYIPLKHTNLFVMYGTDAAIDDAMGKIEALQTQQALQQNARPTWRGFEAGLTREEFNRQHRERIEKGDFVDEDRGFLEGSGSGVQGLGNLIGSLLSGKGFSGWAESEYERRRDDAWGQYQLATGARTASAGEGAVRRIRTSLKSTKASSDQPAQSPRHPFKATSRFRFKAALL